MRDADEHPELATQFTQFARTVARDGGDLYRAISLRVAEEPWLLGLLDLAEPAQRRPGLLLAAVHHLLLGGADHPLADHYPTVRHRRGLEPLEPQAPAEAGELFVDFCRTQRLDLAPLLARRAVQTNEIGRCAALLPALTAVSSATGAPLSVVDLGCSAGLNLLFDRYSYHYTRDDAATPEALEGPGGPVEAGDPASPVRIRCALRGDDVPPLSVPRLARRAGVDLRPADATDPDQARWLLACLWPHDLERFIRLEAAVTMAAALAPDERPVLHSGDMVASVGVLAEDAPMDSELCVVHSWAVAYLTPDEQRALGAAVDDVARRRRVWWVFAEWPFETPELPFAPAPTGHDDAAATALMLVRVDGDGRHPRRLADMHHHGTWLRWWGTP